MALSKRRRVLLAAALLALAVVLWRVCAPAPGPGATLTFVGWRWHEGAPLDRRWTAVMRMKNTGSQSISFLHVETYSKFVIRYVNTAEPLDRAWRPPRSSVVSLQVEPNESNDIYVHDYDARDVCEMELAFNRSPWESRLPVKWQQWLPNFLRGSVTQFRIWSSPIPKPPAEGRSYHDDLDFYQRQRPVSVFGEWSISPSGRFTLFEDTGRLMLFDRQTRQSRNVTDGTYAIPKRITWNETAGILDVVYRSNHAPSRIVLPR